MDMFLDIKTTNNAVIGGGIAIFAYIYNALGTTLGEIRYNMFSHKAAAGPIKPETLPPTERAVGQRSLHANLQTRDWILLQSMSVDPSEYGLTIGIHGFEPVPTLDPMAPHEELLQFTTCNCHGDCSSQRCIAARRVASSVSQHAETAKPFHTRIAS